MRSWALWLVKIHQNTTFIHCQEKVRKALNTIWDIRDKEGHQCSNYKSISMEAKTCYKHLITNLPKENIRDILAS